MTEVLFERPSLERPQKGNGCSHDTHFWCSIGGHWLPKQLAEIVKGRPMCPFDKGAWLRTSTRNRENKHEERVTRY